MNTARGQSETIGAILLVAITVIAVSIVAGALFAANTPSEHPNARIEATADGTNLSIEHRAGQPLHEDEFEIVLRETGTTIAGAAGEPDEALSDGDRVFEPGERWVFDAGYTIADGEDVLLIYTGEDRVLLDEDTIGFEPTSVPESTTATEGENESTTGDPTTTDDGTPECSIGSNNNQETLAFTTFEKFQANQGADEWSISVEVQDVDGDDDLYQFKYEITDSEGTIQATETIGLSGGQYREQNFKIQPDDTAYDVPQDETYTITATICDEDGNSRSTDAQTTS